MRIFHLFVLNFALLTPVSANILHLIEDDPYTIALTSLIKSGISTAETAFQKYNPSNLDDREKVLQLSNQAGVRCTFLFKPGEANFPIIISGPLPNSQWLSADQIQFSKKIMEQVVDFFGSDRVLLPGYIPYVETSHMSAPYVVIQIPRDADLESFANDFKGFLVQTFPQLKEEIPEVQNPTLARQEPVGKPSFLEQSWFEEEVNQPFYDSRQLARDENLSQFRKKTNAQQTDPFEANTNSGSWNLSNPLMSLFASRESSPRAKPAEEEPPAPAPVKKDPEDPFAAYFSQESLHIAPPSGEKLEPARIIKQNILDDTNDNPPSAPTTPKEASVSFEPISTKVFSASLVQTFPKAREKPAIQEPGLTPSLITSQRTDISSSSTDSVSSIIASTPSTAISQTSDATLDLELLYFMQAPWDREPSEPAQPISTTPEPIPEYLKQ